MDDQYILDIAALDQLLREWGAASEGRQREILDTIANTGGDGRFPMIRRLVDLVLSLRQAMALRDEQEGAMPAMDQARDAQPSLEEETA